MRRIHFSKNQLAIIGVVGFIILFTIIVIVTGFGLRPGRERVTLTIWGIDSPASFEAAKEGFKNNRPGLEIIYRQILEDRYEQELINALAAGAGPDVFMFRSDWMMNHRDKIIPISQELFPASKFAELFPQVAVQDFVLNDQVYAFPLFIDTLVLYYNKDIFDRRGVALPPNTWDGFRQAITRRVVASFGGPSPLVARAGDIMNALLMQANADLSLQNKSFIRISNREGTTALNLYTSVRAPAIETYAGFANGTIGMIIDYQSAAPSILARNPSLNFAIAPLPQINPGQPVVPARYYGLAVPRRSLLQSLAWDFIVYATTDEWVAENYLIASGRPPALRTIINSYIGDPTHGVFASQALIARSWNMPASEGVFAIFNTMIQSVIQGGTAHDALSQAETAINRLIR